MYMHMWDHDNMPVLYVLTKRKSLPNIVGVCIVCGNSHSSPWSVLAVWLMQTWLAYLQKKHRFIWHTSPLIPHVEPVHLMLVSRMTIDHTYLVWSTHNNISHSHQQSWAGLLLLRKRASVPIHSTSVNRSTSPPQSFSQHSHWSSGGKDKHWLMTSY
jgi:hypothetical protein